MLRAAFVRYLDERGHRGQRLSDPGDDRRDLQGLEYLLTGQPGLAQHLLVRADAVMATVDGRDREGPQFELDLSTPGFLMMFIRSPGRRSS